MRGLTVEEFKELENRVMNLVKPEDDGTGFGHLAIAISEQAVHASVTAIQEYQKMLQEYDEMPAQFSQQ